MSGHPSTPPGVTERAASGRESPVEARQWANLTDDERERITRLLAVDPDDNLDDVIARCNRALEILRGAS